MSEIRRIHLYDEKYRNKTAKCQWRSDARNQKALSKSSDTGIEKDSKSGRKIQLKILKKQDDIKNVEKNETEVKSRFRLMLTNELEQPAIPFKTLST